MKKPSEGQVMKWIMNKMKDICLSIDLKNKFLPRINIYLTKNQMVSLNGGLGCDFKHVHVLSEGAGYFRLFLEV